MQDSCPASFVLLVVSKESDTLQWQHVLVVVGHLVVVLLPHVNKLITVYQTNKLT